MKQRRKRAESGHRRAKESKGKEWKERKRGQRYKKKAKELPENLPGASINRIREATEERDGGKEWIRKRVREDKQMDKGTKEREREGEG